MNKIDVYETPNVKYKARGHNMYWTLRHDRALSAYLNCNIQAEKNRIFDLFLSDAFYEMSYRALTFHNIPLNYDYIQNIVLHLLTKAAPKIRKSKLKGAFQYLWVSATNYVKSYIITGRRYLVYIEDMLVSNRYLESVFDGHKQQHWQSQLNFLENRDAADFNNVMPHSYIRSEYLSNVRHPFYVINPFLKQEIKMEREKVIKKTLCRIDALLQLNSNLKMHATNYRFLQELKYYLLNNDFEVSGFNQYVMKKMGINIIQLRAIAYRNGLRTYDFNCSLTPKQRLKLTFKNNRHEQN